MNGYSITSNEAKLFKHMDNLQSFQIGKSKPVLFHVSPTNKCNMNCTHCCFSNRDRNIEIPFDKLKKAIKDMKEIGIKSVEFTGGGEPTLYYEINNLTSFVRNEGLALGMNTNGLSINKVKEWSKFDWVRVSLNVFDLDIDINKFVEDVNFLQTKTHITSCYIASNNVTREKMETIVSFAEEQKIPTRIAPDCIQKKQDIRNLIDKINEMVPKSEYVFVSDFNIFLGERRNNNCWCHYLKPFLYSDGWVYACPSSELAYENGRTMKEEFRICRMEDIPEFYSNEPVPKIFGCSYCKYTNQNNILDSIRMRTDFNAFC